MIHSPPQYFALNLEMVERIASGDDLGDAVDYLLRTEYSRRLLLIREIINAVQSRPELLGPFREPGLGWRVLAAAQAAAPASTRRLIGRPAVGLWAAHTLRVLAGAAQDEAPIWCHLAYLSRLAASAALLGGIEADLEVPIEGGRIDLPGLGVAETRLSSENWALGRISIAAGKAWLRATSPRQQLTFDAPAQSALRCVASGWELSIDLETAEPYPRLFGLTPSGCPEDRLPDAWQRVLDPAWALLVREHPGQVAGLGAGLRAIIPLDANDPTSPASGSAADGFGAAAVTRSVDPVDLAVALIHEFQHSLLNGLLHLVPMIEPDSRLFYAPWRDDPRSLGSLLHGAYAFSGVTRFWCERRLYTEGQPAQAAEFEFALWRARTAAVISTLEESAVLTTPGLHFVGVLRAQIDAWLTEKISDHAVAAAWQAIRAHESAWRAHHLQVDQAWIGERVAGWETGHQTGFPAGAADLRHSSPVVTVRPDDGVGFLDNLTRLHRQRLRGCVGSEDAAGRSPSPADAALAAGEGDAARDLYLDELGHDDRPAAWGGLGLALELLAQNSNDGVSRTLVDRPELVRALHQGLRRSGQQPTVIEVATWLAANLSSPTLSGPKQLP